MFWIVARQRHEKLLVIAAGAHIPWRGYLATLNLVIGAIVMLKEQSVLIYIFLPRNESFLQLDERWSHISSVWSVRVGSLAQFDWLGT